MKGEKVLDFTNAIWEQRQSNNSHCPSSRTSNPLTSGWIVNLLALVQGKSNHWKAVGPRLKVANLVFDSIKYIEVSKTESEITEIIFLYFI